MARWYAPGGSDGKNVKSDVTRDTSEFVRSLHLFELDGSPGDYRAGGVADAAPESGRPPSDHIRLPSARTAKNRALHFAMSLQPSFGNPVVRINCGPQLYTGPDRRSSYFLKLG
jgi:hypothetical protein